MKVSPLPAGRARLVAMMVLAATLAACGGSSNAGTTTARPATVTAPSTAATQARADAPPFAPVVASSELVVGYNRFTLGIIDQKTGQPVPDAEVKLRFFTVQGNQGTPRFEGAARFVAPARDAGVAPIVPHRHADGNTHPHANAEADVGVYAIRLEFDQPGKWGVEATFRAPDGREGKVTAPFEVLAQPVTPPVGAPAPRTRNLTVRDVKDISEIDSAIEPLAAFHQDTVADAIAAGRPTLVAFVTPGYCATRFCGPAYEVLKKLQPKFDGKAAMIHIEIWRDPVNKVPFEAVVEWKLQSEPYIFVIDRAGVITAKFEGPVSLAELDEALTRVTS